MSEIVRLDSMNDNELVEREGRIERAQRNAYYEIGLEYKQIRDKELYKTQRDKPISGRYSFTTFDEYVEERWDMKLRRVEQLIESCNTVVKLEKTQNFAHIPTKESHVRELLKLESDADRALVWQSVVDSGETIKASTVHDAVQKYQAAKEKNWLTVDEWKSSEEKPLFAASNKTFNKQGNASIEWAQWSWNPITGCLHPCPYCYAKDIAKRFYPQGFEPSIYPERMAMPGNTKVPDSADHDIAFKNVFTCSMADLFGRWVPDEWIKEVFRQVRANQQWNFLFLTKFPKRMVEFDYPDNAWLGTTVDCQDRVKSAEDAFENVSSGTKWISVEPLLEPLTFTRLDLFDWLVIGGASKSSGTPEWVPPLEWIIDLHNQAREAGCKIYYKENTKLPDELRMKEYPWKEGVLRKLPAEFKYLNMV